jgi:predicted nucleic acid-binding protein
MSDKFFLDTNILVYAHDRTTGTKHERARTLLEKLWSTGSGVLSTQVLQELCINLRRKAKHPMSVEETRRLIEDYSRWDIVINTAESVLQALTIEVRYKISFWDALLLQAAGSCGATVLYSEDLAEGQSYGSVHVVNPLREPVSESSG